MSTREWTFAITIWAFVLVGVFAWWRWEAKAPDRRGPLVITGVLVDEEHLVTPEMQAASDAMADRPAPGFMAESHEGQMIDSATLVGDRPVFLVFIKDGCPCSTSAEPFFARLHESYGDRASFLGVIDGDAEIANRWVLDHRTPYPVLADEELAIVRAFEVQNSAYVVLIDQEGQITAQWPGYSEDILREMSARLAAMTGRTEAEVGAEEAPELPYSGCPFPLEDTEVAKET
ncbi:peroxiredoxin family protein [Tautonia rosea]|uniref:peroxiredoxin family protein n=1 Tax=Tautonia rosea TaxID=2728037 RepID=UPI001474AED1|nr:redoxin domain-containing protein [Tautonia rosea]